jgi:hypothetical protein
MDDHPEEVLTGHGCRAADDSGGTRVNRRACPDGQAANAVFVQRQSPRRGRALKRGVEPRGQPQQKPRGGSLTHGDITWTSWMMS